MSIKSSVNIFIFLLGFLISGILPILFVNQGLLSISPIFVDSKVPIVFYLIIFCANVMFGYKLKINLKIFYFFIIISIICFLGFCSFWIDP